MQILGNNSSPAEQVLQVVPGCFPVPDEDTYTIEGESEKVRIVSIKKMI